MAGAECSAWPHRVRHLVAHGLECPSSESTRAEGRHASRRRAVPESAPFAIGPAQRVRVDRAVLDGERRPLFAGVDITPLASITSVKQAFEGLQCYYFNIEISWSETWKDVMVRVGDSTDYDDDPDDGGDRDVTLARFLRTTSSGAPIESSAVMFSAYQESEDAAAFALHPVAHDERYPYHPQSRQRQDVTTAISIKKYPACTSSLSSLSSNGDGDSVVVMARSYHTRLHRSHLQPHTEEALDELGVASKVCFRVMLNSIYANMNASSSSAVFRQA